MTRHERARQLGALGYTLRASTRGVYFLTRPDGSRTYRTDMTARRCNCPSLTECKHLLYLDRVLARRFNRGARRVAAIARLRAAV